MFSFLALGFVFFTKTDIVQASCNYFESLGSALAVTSQCMSLGSDSYKSTCVSSNIVEVSSYSSNDCSGTPTKQNYTGSDVHCDGETCFAEVKIGSSCSNFGFIIYFPFDMCFDLGTTNYKITCSSMSNYTSDTCSSSDIDYSYVLDKCIATSDDSVIYITDGSGYCDSELTTTTTTTTDTCNYFELEGYPFAVTSKCLSYGGASITSKCVTSSIIEASFYNSSDCSGISYTTNYTGYCGGDTCYAEVKIGTSCSRFVDAFYLPFGTCVEINGTNVKVTCNEFANYTSDSCPSSSIDESYSLDKCYTNNDGSTVYIKDATGYCSIANGLNTNILRSIIAILFVVYLFH